MAGFGSRGGFAWTVAALLETLLVLPTLVSADGATITVTSTTYLKWGACAHACAATPAIPRVTLTLPHNGEDTTITKAPGCRGCPGTVLCYKPTDKPFVTLTLTGEGPKPTIKTIHPDCQGCHGTGTVYICEATKAPSSKTYVQPSNTDTAYPRIPTLVLSNSGTDESTMTLTPKGVGQARFAIVGNPASLAKPTVTLPHAKSDAPIATMAGAGPDAPPVIIKGDLSSLSDLTNGALLGVGNVPDVKITPPKVHVVVPDVDVPDAHVNVVPANVDIGGHGEIDVKGDGKSGLEGEFNADDDDASDLGLGIGNPFDLGGGDNVKALGKTKVEDDGAKSNTLGSGSTSTTATGTAATGTAGTSKGTTGKGKAGDKSHGDDDGEGGSHIGGGYLGSNDKGNDWTGFADGRCNGVLGGIGCSVDSAGRTLTGTASKVKSAVGGELGGAVDETGGGLGGMLSDVGNSLDGIGVDS